MTWEVRYGAPHSSTITHPLSARYPHFQYVTTSLLGLRGYAVGHVGKVGTIDCAGEKPRATETHRLSPAGLRVPCVATFEYGSPLSYHALYTSTASAGHGRWK